MGTLVEKPVEAALMVELTPLVGTLLVMLIAMELAVVTGAVGPTEGALLVPFPYGASVATLENEKPPDVVLTIPVGTPMISDALLVLSMDEEFPVETGAVGPTVGVLVPLPYGAPVMETLEKNPLEMALEVLTMFVGTPISVGTLIVTLMNVELPVEIGAVGPIFGVVVPLP